MDTKLATDRSHDLDMLRAVLRKFAAKEMPREKAREWDRSEVFPRDVFAPLVRLGVTGLTVPEQYGDSGVDVGADLASVKTTARIERDSAEPGIQ